MSGVLPNKVLITTKFAHDGGRCSRRVERPCLHLLPSQATTTFPTPEVRPMLSLTTPDMLVAI